MEEQPKCFPRGYLQAAALRDAMDVCDFLSSRSLFWLSRVAVALSAHHRPVSFAEHLSKCGDI